MTNVVSIYEDRSKLFLEHRRQAYINVFSGPDGQVVLADLANFCRALETTYHEDARVTDMLNGRREVIQRIMEHTRMSFDDLWELKRGR